MNRVELRELHARLGRLLEEGGRDRYPVCLHVEASGVLHEQAAWLMEAGAAWVLRNVEDVEVVDDGDAGCVVIAGQPEPELRRGDLVRPRLGRRRLRLLLVDEQGSPVAEPAQMGALAAWWVWDGWSVFVAVLAGAGGFSLLVRAVAGWLW